MTLASLGTSDDIITLHNAVATFPTPTLGTEGASCARWIRNMILAGELAPRGYGPANGLVTIGANIQTTLDKPLGIYGILDVEANLLGVLNGGAPIRIANIKAPCSFEFNTGGFTHFCVGGLYGDVVSPSGGALLTAKVRPLHFVDA